MQVKQNFASWIYSCCSIPRDLNRGSAGSEIIRDKNTNYISIKEESIYATKVRKDLQWLKRLGSMKLKRVKFRIVETWNLSLRYDDRYSWFSAVKLNIFRKTNFISFSYIPRSSNWQSMSFWTVAKISFIDFFDFYWPWHLKFRIIANVTLEEKQELTFVLTCGDTRNWPIRSGRSQWLGIKTL